MFLLVNAPWRAPIPLYLEQYLLPLYIASAVAGYWGALRAVGVLTVRIGTLFVTRALSASMMLVIAVVPIMVTRHVLRTSEGTVYSDPWANEGEILTFLSEQIGLTVGQSFRGRVDFPPMDPNSSNTVVTLWARGVPTVNEYSQQFSRCLRSRNANVRLMRANLLATAMIFSGDIDTDIVFDYGMFSPRCRFSDLADLKELDMKIEPARGAFVRRSAFSRLAWCRSAPSSSLRRDPVNARTPEKATLR